MKTSETGTDRIQALLTRLAGLDIKLSLETGQLRINAPAGALDDALKQALKQNREALIARLQQSTAAADSAWPSVDPDPAKRHEPFPLTDIQQAYWIGRSSQFT